MRPRTLLPLFLALVLIPGCRASPGGPSAPALPGYTLVWIKTGPMSGRLSDEENKAAFAGHFANMERLADARQLVVAGPFGKERHDDSLRGLFVLATESRAEAEAWASTDPTAQAGVFVLEYHDLATEAPLRWALEEDIAWRAAQEAQGRTPSPGEGARPYALLTVDDAERAWRELAPLATPEGGVLLLARLDGSRALALLDADDSADARERFAPQLENVGPHVLDDWFASSQLARMVTR